MASGSYVGLASWAWFTIERFKTVFLKIIIKVPATPPRYWSRYHSRHALLFDHQCYHVTVPVQVNTCTLFIEACSNVVLIEG